MSTPEYGRTPMHDPNSMTPGGMTPGGMSYRTPNYDGSFTPVMMTPRHGI